MKKIAVTQDALYMMLLATARYAMGRRTYITAMFADYAIAYGKHLSPHQRLKIAEEIRAEFASGRSMGDPCDRTEWERAIEALDGNPHPMGGEAPGGTDWPVRETKEDKP